MKYSQDMLQKKAVLVLDEDNPITEITCRSIFPNLSSIRADEIENKAEIWEDESCDLVILDTTDPEISTEILLRYETGKVEVVPMKLPQLDGLKFNGKTLAQLVLFELNRLKFQSLRSKANFLLSSNLSGIGDRYADKQELSELIFRNPELFYSFCLALNKNDEAAFTAFCLRLNQLSMENEGAVVDKLIKCASDSSCLEQVGKLFCKSADSFYHRNTFETVSDASLGFFEGIVRGLKKSVYAIPDLTYALQCFFIAFDLAGKFKAISLLSEIKAGSGVLEKITLSTLCGIHGNQNFPEANLDELPADLSKKESARLESSKFILEIAKDRNSMDPREKLELSKAFVDYSAYLLGGSDLNALPKWIREYASLTKTN